MTREEAIRILASSCIPGSKQTEALETLIPELAESEDERIRKKLVKYHSQQFEKNRDQEIGLFHKDALAYLEKQKEQKQTDLPAGFYVTLPDGKKYYTKEMRCKGMNIKVVEPKPSEWSEEDEKMRDKIISDLEWERRNTTVDKDIRHYDEELHWLKSLKPKYIVKTIKKDDKPIDCDLSDIDDDFQGLNSEAICKSYKGDCINCPHNRTKNKNKSLQSNSEWRHYIWATNLRFDFTTLIKYDNTDNYEIVQAGNRPKQEKNGVYILIKDIKPQSHWKPSEEHLSALLAIFNDPNNIGSQTCQLALTDLYEQLKKL